MRSILEHGLALASGAGAVFIFLAAGCSSADASRYVCTRTANSCTCKNTTDPVAVGVESCGTTTFSGAICYGTPGSDDCGCIQIACHSRKDGRGFCSCGVGDEPDDEQQVESLCTAPVGGVCCKSQFSGTCSCGPRTACDPNTPEQLVQVGSCVPREMTAEEVAKGHSIQACK